MGHPVESVESAAESVSCKLTRELWGKNTNLGIISIYRRGQK